jgi:hypothetical protein
MTKEQKERNLKLADALKSGKYKQTRGRLRTVKTKRFCCLGLACELFIKDTKKLSWNSYGAIGGYSWSALPPSEVRKYYGWKSHDPVLEIGDYITTATRHNDDSKLSFAEIAEGFENLANSE